jgi:hypothetical protein
MLWLLFTVKSYPTIYGCSVFDFHLITLLVGSFRFLIISSNGFCHANLTHNINIYLLSRSPTDNNEHSFKKNAYIQNH